MFGFKMKLGLGNKVLLPEYGQKKALDLGQFVSSNLNTDIFSNDSYFGVRYQIAGLAPYQSNIRPRPRHIHW
jgi:hypothetical protein